MSLFLKTTITICGAVGMVITTERIIVELNYGTIPMFIFFVVVFTMGLITLSKESKRRAKKYYKSLTDKNSERHE